MNNDRLLNILRWVVTPIVLACITGYYESRVRGAKEQTRASYDTLAPGVLELQDKVATLTGRLEEISKRPVSPCSETKPAAPAAHAPKPHATGLEGLGAMGTGKTAVMVDSPANMPAPSPSKVPARFDDMIQQRAK